LNRKVARDRLERNLAIAPKQIAQPGLETEIVEPLIAEMALHPVEPRREPATA